jgi:hypothetical protein
MAQNYDNMNFTKLLFQFMVSEDPTFSMFE